MLRIRSFISIAFLSVSLFATNLMAESRLACDNSPEYILLFKYGDPLAERPPFRSEGCCEDKIGELGPRDEIAALKYAKESDQFLRSSRGFGEIKGSVPFIDPFIAFIAKMATSPFAAFCRAIWAIRGT